MKRQVVNPFLMAFAMTLFGILATLSRLETNTLIGMAFGGIITVIAMK